MLSVDDVRKEIYKLGAIINAPRELLVLSDFPNDTGMASIAIIDDEYHYVLSERGSECSRKKTADLNLFLYWFFSDVVSEMACKFELMNRVPNQDSRRIMFAKKLELIGLLYDNWYDLEEKSIAAILSSNPYDDDVDKRMLLSISLSESGLSAAAAYEEACKKYPVPS